LKERIAKINREKLSKEQKKSFKNNAFIAQNLFYNAE
jgi:hypothetical protein